ncbi:PqqD family protein [Streptomyces sp. NBC_01190]|uniref:PqqD family protein n=1 Tax=Streptomyces sp. NBC_01190 TaxID=2903767 RepID=UPI003870D2A3|nr:PqqD family protein [Streptomyces sp. NBC_01190]
MFYRISEDLVWIAEEGEVRMYDAASGEFRTLNSTAAEVWPLLAEGATTEAICTEMARRYAPEDPDWGAQVAQDVRTFLAGLAEEGIVTEEEQSVAAEGAS